MSEYVKTLDKVHIEARHYNYDISYYYNNLHNKRQQEFIDKTIHHGVIWSGFWVRRVHDGTAPLLVDFISEKLRQFDPALHQELGL